MKENYLEYKVGAFVLIGLVVIGVLIILFGQFGQFFTSTYTIVAEFPNASGIIKNAQVLYRGAKVGVVQDAPQIAKEGATVELVLSINNNIRLPKNAEFKIGSYGLLGDRFVDVVPPPGANGNGTIEYLRDGDRVQGLPSKGMAEFLDEAEQKLQKFDAMVVDIKTKLITDEFVKNFHGSVENANLLLQRGNAFMLKAEKGEGPLHTIVNDRETAQNIEQFIYNLRTSGILFYRDHFKEAPTPEERAKARERERYKSRR